MSDIISESKPIKDAHFIEDCPSYTIKCTDWCMQGYSIAGERTGFYIKSLNLYLDAGMNSYKTGKYMLLTHSHADHSNKVPELVMGQSIDDKPIIYCPKEMVDPLRLYCKASQSLNDCAHLIKDDVIRWIGVSSGEKYILDIHKRKIVLKLYVDVVKCCHKVPSVGFILSTEKKKLKTKYKNLSGKELGDLRKQGVDIQEMIIEKKLAFMGDTTIEAMKNPLLKDVPTIIVECTGVDDQISVSDTESRGHIHWYQLKPIIEKNPETTFILIHFSRMYSEDYLEKYFQDNGLPNVVIWLPNKVIQSSSIKPNLDLSK